MECPCKGCVPPRRNGICHDICEDYKKWREHKDIENKRIEEKRFLDRNLYHRIQ